jgi:hypothetical protein
VVHNFTQYMHGDFFFVIEIDLSELGALSEGRYKDIDLR